MRKIIVATFMSMDGVLQGPGGPHEDPTNGFKWSGWSVNYWDDLMNERLGKIMAGHFDLLLGHFTYDIFAAHWPYQKDDPIGVLFNKITKYVVATKPVDLSWQNSVAITGDIVSELKKLKRQEGPDLLVHGSSKLMQLLLANNLVDILHLLVFPVTLGKGKKLFEEGARPGNWKQTDAFISTTGVVVASYVPDGDIKVGTFAPDKPSNKEIERRKKLDGQ